jgi:hypothetical protein
MPTQGTPVLCASTQCDPASARLKSERSGAYFMKVLSLFSILFVFSVLTTGQASASPKLYDAGDLVIKESLMVEAGDIRYIWQSPNSARVFCSLEFKKRANRRTIIVPQTIHVRFEEHKEFDGGFCGRLCSGSRSCNCAPPIGWVKLYLDHPQISFLQCQGYDESNLGVFLEVTRNQLDVVLEAPQQW